jgi:hypothetical protein
MTQNGLAAHLGVGLSTLKDYGARPEYSATFRHICTLMTAHNIDGAASGDMNGNIISRVEGLADKQDLMSSDGSMSPKESIDLSKLSNDELQALESIISKANTN